MNKTITLIIGVLLAAIGFGAQAKPSETDVLNHYADLAHANGVPLIIDNTVATPYLIRPFEHGADIVVHSLSKTAGTGGEAIAGGIIARYSAASLTEPAAALWAAWAEALRA